MGGSTVMRIFREGLTEMVTQSPVEKNGSNRGSKHCKYLVEV